MGQGLPKGASRTFEEKREDGDIKGSGGESWPRGQHHILHCGWTGMVPWLQASESPGGALRRASRSTAVLCFPFPWEQEGQSGGRGGVVEGAKGVGGGREAGSRSHSKQQQPNHYPNSVHDLKGTRGKIESEGGFCLC